MWDQNDDRLIYRDIEVIIKSVLNDPESNVFKAIHPNEWQWDLKNQLMAGVLDQLRALNWRVAGASEQEFPEPIERPGVEKKEQDLLFDNVLSIGGVSTQGGGLNRDTIVDAREWLGWESEL